MTLDKDIMTALCDMDGLSKRTKRQNTPRLADPNPIPKYKGVNFLCSPAGYSLIHTNPLNKNSKWMRVTLKHKDSPSAAEEFIFTSLSLFDFMERDGWVVADVGEVAVDHVPHYLIRKHLAILKEASMRVMALVAEFHSQVAEIEARSAWEEERKKGG